MKESYEIKQIILKSGSALVSLSLMVTVLNVNTTYMLFVHQSKFPDNTRKLGKF
jgi:cyclic lactone autoinducer peptide